MQRTLKVALIGVGRWGMHWLRLLLAHPQVELVAIAEADPTRHATLRTQFDLPSGLRLMTDGATAIATPHLDAVVIVTPAATHYELIHLALARGCHVLAEKPLTLDPSEARSLCALADRQQRLLLVDHTYLFHPAVQAGQQWLQTQALGEIRYAYATRTHLGPIRSDVDALWDLAIHDLTILQAWLGASPIAGSAVGHVWLQGDRGDPTYFPQGLADQVWVRLEYPQQVTAQIHLCWVNPDKQRRLAIVGSQGTLVFDELAAQPLLFYPGTTTPTATAIVPRTEPAIAIPVPTQEPLQAVCNHFMTAIEQGQIPARSPGWLGADLVQVLAALTRSLNQGGVTVTLTPPPTP